MSTINHTLIGIWIDHKQAHIVSGNSTKANYKIQTIESFVHKRPHKTGGFPGGAKNRAGHVNMVNEQRIQRHRDQLLNQYYTAILKQLREADGIYVLGPGSAKKEFEKLLKKNRSLSTKVSAVDTSSPMTKRQLISKVHKFFTSHTRRRG